MPSVKRSAWSVKVYGAGAVTDCHCEYWLDANIVVKSLELSLAVLTSPPPETATELITPVGAFGDTFTVSAIDG